MVDESTLDHEDEVVEKSEDIRVRLMDSHDNCLVLFFGHVGKILDNDERSE